MPDHVTFLVDQDRPSYVEAAELYREAFLALNLAVHERSYAPHAYAAQPGEWVLHHTIGPLFHPVAGAHNTAVVFHEWDRYPSTWVGTLNTFQSVWAPSMHVALTLRRSGVTTPIAFVPPPIAARSYEIRSAWTSSSSFRYLSIGEAHFRKGFHLLIDGFLRAFPQEGDALLTLKISPSCVWRSPRKDIVLIADRLSRQEVQSLYRCHDAYVSASLGEGLGLPVAEAVLSGLPVITNWWGGHRDVVQPSDCWAIAHDLVPQVFCSDPSYYAEGQRCAYSTTAGIAGALRAARGAAAEEREARARRARAALEASHGVARVATLVREQCAAIAAAPSHVLEHASIR